ncbi:hypothetical protein N8D56_04840 [Devosia sp. A8/3-2]|nr:hypothetical protein N8D56_04840 [Devosia sp. A8/3-2]
MPRTGIKANHYEPRRMAVYGAVIATPAVMLFAGRDVSPPHAIPTQGAGKKTRGI